MPRLLNHINPEIIQFLKSEVEFNASFKINSKKNCQRLSYLIENLGLGKVSGSTIYRLFKNQNVDSDFYEYTLNILINFINIHNLNANKLSFNNELVPLNNFSDYEKKFNQLNINNHTLSLLSICIQQKQYKPIHIFLEKNSMFDNMQENFLFGVELYNALSLFPQNNALFFEQFSQNQVIRNNFFEINVDTEFQLKDYEYGFYQYLSKSNPELGNIETRDFVFGHLILLRNAYSTNNYLKVKELGEILYDNTDFDNYFKTYQYLLPKFRYYCYKVFFLWANNKIKELLNYVDFLLNITKFEYVNANFFNKKILFYTLSETICSLPIYTMFEKQIKLIFREYLLCFLNEKEFDFPLNSFYKSFDYNGLNAFRALSR